MAPIISELSAPAWRFDALDARAGMAFASRVDSTVDGDDIVVFFRPPGFEPQPVGRSSLALGATRGSFQGGLLIEGQEARFPSLAAIGEFVRRVYVGSASGDGGPGPTGGGEPPPTIPPDEPGGEPESSDSTETTPESEALVNGLHHFRVAVKSCRPGEACALAWTQPPAARSTGSGGDLLFRGAMRISRRILLKWRSQPGFPPDERLLHLAATIWRMGVDPENMQYRMQQSKAQWMAGVSAEAHHAFVAMDWWHPLWLLHHRTNPLEVLDLLPSPSSQAEPGRTETLLGWLCRFLAAPAEVLRDLSPQQAIDYATFAAAVITYRQDVQHGWPDAKAQTTRAECENAALNWLREHLPRMAYAAAFETALGQLAG